MAQLILDWLNEDVKLSRRVESLADDFEDGTLLGELLHIYNQQNDFDKFMFKGNSDSKINNFCLLETTMKRLGIVFNSKTAFDVMSGNVGVIRTLLYEIKTAVEMIAKTSKPVLVKSKDGLLEEKLPRIISGAKAVYDKSMSQTFENCVRMYIENPTDALMAEATKRFKEKEVAFMNMVATKTDSAETDIREELQRRKTIEKQRKRQEKEFLETWNAMNVDQWKKNQTVARERKAIKERNDSFLLSKRDAGILKARTEARDSALNGIDEFEQKLRTEIFPVDPDLQETVGRAIQSFGGGDDTDIPGLTTLNEKYLNDGLTHAQKKLKEHHEDLIQTQKMHNRRRLKFFTEEEGLHMSHLRHETEAEIVAQLMNLSQPEKISNDTKRNVLQTVPIAQQNIAFRESLISDLNTQTLAQRGKFELEKASREREWVVQSRIIAQSDILNLSILAETSAKQQNNLEFARDVLDKYLDFVDWVCWTREVGNFREIPVSDIVLPPILLEDAVRCFVEDVAFPPSIPFPVQLNASDVLPHSLTSKPVFSDAEWIFKKVFSGKDALAYNYPDDATNAEDTVVRMLADRDRQNFVSQLTQPVSSEVVEIAPGLDPPPSEADMSLPPDWLVATPPENLLGETIIALRCIVNPIPEDPEPNVKIPEKFLSICIFGSSETARNALSGKLSADYGLEIIVVENLLHFALESAVKLSSSRGSELSPEEILYERIYLSVTDGANLPDELYVALLGFKIRALVSSDLYNGFVVEDFPRTKNQAALLLQELSSIDYTTNRAHPTDRLSAYATPFPFEESNYDPSKCGIDAIIMIDTDVSSVISQKLSYRKDLCTGEIVYINARTENVTVLAEEYSPLSSSQVIGSSAKSAIECAADLKPFLKKLSLLKQYSAADYESENVMTDAISQDIAVSYPKKSNCKQTEFIVDNQQGIDNSVAIDAVVDAPDENGASGNAPPADSVDLTPVVAELRRASVPLQLASALCGIWEGTENASTSVTCSTFSSLRDIRYQMVQRCRNTSDSIGSLIICKERKQNIFEDFRNFFNLIPEDLRFDPDMITELHLRALEMRSKLSDITDKRRKEAEDRLLTIAADGTLGVLCHRSRCEASLLIQSELNRFIASCHLLLDSSKALCKFKNTSRFANELEEALPVGEGGGEKVDSKGGKDAKGKAPAKGKAAETVIVPYRDPVAPTILNADVMSAIPKPASAAAVAVDPKKDAKGKKVEAEPVPADPFLLAEKAATDYLNTFSTGTYTINRSLYSVIEGAVDPVVERVCSSVEKAVCCEAARLLRTLTIIRQILQTHLEWLESTEASNIKYLTGVIFSQWSKEVAADERLIAMIQGRIEQCEPIRDTWKICADAISVETNKLVVSDPQPFPSPVINHFLSHNFNEEQSMLFSKAFQDLSVQGTVLEQDVDSLIHIFSSSGTLGCCVSETAKKIEDEEMHKITVTNEFLDIPDGLLFLDLEGGVSPIKRCLISTAAKRIGYTEEHLGIIPLSDLVHNLLSKTQKKKKAVSFAV